MTYTADSADTAPTFHPFSSTNHQNKPYGDTILPQGGLRGRTIISVVDYENQTVPVRKLTVPVMSHVY